MRLHVFLVAAGLLGCVDIHHSITVRTRDPTAVALDVRTPAGTRRIVAPGDGLEASPIPAETAGIRGSRADRSALRLADGAIVLRCPQCPHFAEIEVLHADGTLTVYGSSDQIRWSPDGLHVVFSYPYILRRPRGRHTPGGPYQAEAFSAELATPRANVLEVLDRRIASRDAARSELGIGVASVLLGGAAWSLAALAHDRTLSTIGVVDGLVLTGVGAAMIGAGGYQLHVAGTTVRLDPPPR